MTPNCRSRMLDLMHETARELHRLGGMNKRRTGEFDAVCKLEVPAECAQDQAFANN